MKLNEYRINRNIETSGTYRFSEVKLKPIENLENHRQRNQVV